MPWYAEGSAVLACVLLVGIPARRRRVRAILGMLVLVLALATGVISCGGGGGASGGGGAGGGGGASGGGGAGGGGGCTEKTDPGTTPGSYTVTVTGTSGPTTVTTALNLTVQ